MSASTERPSAWPSFSGRATGSQRTQESIIPLMLPSYFRCRCRDLTGFCRDRQSKLVPKLSGGHRSGLAYRGTSVEASRKGREDGPPEGLNSQVCQSTMVADLAEARLVELAMGSRALRNHHFGSALFNDPAWDILLALHRALLQQQRITVGSLCSSAGLPLGDRDSLDRQPGRSGPCSEGVGPL